MTPDPVSIQENILAAEALKVMQDRNINGILVVDEQQKITGALNMHDLLRAGLTS